MNPLQLLGVLLLVGTALSVGRAVAKPIRRWLDRRRRRNEALAMARARAGWARRDPAAPRPATDEIRVTFARSGKVCRWDPRAGSLLEFAEENGVRLESGCRAGECGACVTIANGEIRYVREPWAEPAPGTCLACIAIPATHVELDA